MNHRYVLDACALIAFLTGEQGGEIVRSTLHSALHGEATVCMNKINLLEVYYDALRSHGREAATSMLGSIVESPIEIIAEISDAVFLEAGRLKASYRMSLADTIAVSEALVSGGILLTADHHELDALKDRENISFLWIR